MLSIDHLGAQFQYDIQSVELGLSAGLLNLEVTTVANASSPFSHLAPPTLHIEDAVVSVMSLDELGTEEVNVPVGWDTDTSTKTDNIFRIYINQHLALNNNHLTLRRTDVSHLAIDWTCECQNILWYRNPNNRLRLNCLVPVNG